MTKTVVALVFGGRSSEHAISCATAAGVLSAIDRTRYDVLPLGITADGALTLQPDDAALFALDADALPAVADNGTRVHLPDSRLSREFTVVENGVLRSLGAVDVVFPILHGPWGEDGTIQGMFDLVDLPYVGSGVLASALGMDKHVGKTVLQAAGIPVAPWRLVTRTQLAADAGLGDRCLAELGLPAFVKPARAGSSVGVSRVDAPEELTAALELAFASDERVLIESGLVGRELEVGVLGGHGGEPARASVVGEIVVTGGRFYDFEAKYLGGAGVEVICPADVTPAELADLQARAVETFDALGCAGLSRVDFFLTADGPVVNEINTMPGFTPVSMFPKLWAASGVPYPTLIDALLELALEPRAR